MTFTVTPITAGADQLQIMLPNGWTFVSPPGFGSGCGWVTVTGFSPTSCGGVDNGGIVLGGPSGLTAGTTITVEVPANTFNVGTGRNFGVLTSRMTPSYANVDTGSATLAGGTPSYAIGYNGNGSTSGSVSSPNTSSGSLTLPANGFTKTGSTFSGWRVGNASSGTIYQPGDTVTGLTSAVLVYAQWTTSSGGSASANLSLNASTGQLIAGSTVGVSASGLQSTAAYTVTVQSTPQTIGSGNAVSGAVNTSVALPAGLEAGWHTLTFSSTAADGSAMTSVAYFKVSASGTLLATSTTIPAELANTGIDSTNGIMFLLGGLSLALIGAEMIMIARRKRSN
jgi:LPXTG-motif cell wall-anchored protein